MTPDEALAYILPDDAPASLLSKMESMGLNVLSYKAGDNADRLEKVNSVQGAKFSLKDKPSPTYGELISKGPLKVVDIRSKIATGSYKEMKDAAVSLADKGGWFDAPHLNIDTNSFVFLTRKSFTHAFSNLKADFGEDTIRCMAHIPEIINTAVLVKTEPPKNPTKQEVKVYTFLGAIRSMNGIEPVKLTVKEFDYRTIDAAPKNIRNYFKKSGIMESYNSLYDVKALEVIGVEGIKKEPNASGKVYGLNPEAHATFDSKISIEKLFKLVNRDAQKYIPIQHSDYDTNKVKSLLDSNDSGKLSLKDSQGRELSAQQQEYFKNSKVRDENGNLLVMYHGTPSGNFSVFRDGSYFTPNREYADRYQNPGASSIRSGKVADAPKTYEVYLDIKKPFDITNPKARKIYINEYIKGGNAAGINPYLPDSEYRKIKTVDWTEGEDLRDFLIDNEYDYDGLILDEGADGGYGDAVVYRGLSYVTFSPEQIKSVDNKTPTANSDINLSLKTENVSKEYTRLRAENKALRKSLEYWKGQTKRTKQNSINRKDVDRYARELVETHDSTIDTEWLREMLYSMGDYLVQESEISFEELRETALEIAAEIVRTAETESTDDAYGDSEGCRQSEKRILRRIKKEPLFTSGSKCWR